MKPALERTGNSGDHMEERISELKDKSRNDIDRREEIKVYKKIKYYRTI